MAFGLGGILGDITGGIGDVLGGLGTRQAGTTTTTSTNVQDLPDWIKPYVTNNLNRAQDVRNGLDVSPIGDAGTAELMKTINGGYLTSNPYLDQIYDHASKLIGAGVDSRFESSGRYGSNSHAEALAEPLAGLAGNLYGGNYSAERGRQAAAAMGAPSFGMGLEQSALYPYTAFSGLIPNLRTGTGTETSPYFDNPLGTLAGLGAAAYGISRRG